MIAPSSKKRAFAHSFALHVPSRVVTNDELSTLMDTTDEWIRQRTGIEERRWADAPTTTSDLAAAAAKKSLEQSGSSIDAIIAATLSPDFCFPGIGVSIQHKLGLPPIPAFDVRNQCSGFLYSLQMAQAFVESGIYRSNLVVGAEIHSTGLDVTTRGRDIAVLFGDGAGSCIVDDGSTPTPGVRFEILGLELHSDGKYASDLWCEHPGSAHYPIRVTADLVAEHKLFPSMNGRKVFEHAVRGMTEVSRSLMKQHGVSIQDIGLVIPHQANLRINQMVGNELGIAPDKVFNTIAKLGNTTAATIPIGIACALEQKEQHHFSPGTTILLTAFGSGFTWGAALLRCH